MSSCSGTARSVAINRGGAGIDHASHTGGAGGNEQAERNIGAVAMNRDGIGDGTRHGSQPRLVKDDLHAGTGSLADLRINQVAFEDSIASRPIRFSPPSGEEIIDAPRTRSPRWSSAAAMERPMETRCSCHKKSRQGSPSLNPQVLAILMTWVILRILPENRLAPQNFRR